MRAYALDYEFGTARHIALKMPECLFYAGQLKSTQDAVGAARTKLAELDERLEACGQKLKVLQSAPAAAPGTCGE